LLSLPLEFTLEGYYKQMSNIIDYKPGTNFLVAGENDWQDLVETGGRGRSRGLEAFLRKTSGDLTGWVSYTWSKSEQQFAGINGGQWYPNRYDRRHNFAVMGQYKLDDDWTVSATWVYSSGHAVTLPTALITDLDGNRIPVYTSRNNQRVPAYHRLDLGFNHTWETKRERLATLSFGLYNAYSRANPLYIDYSVTNTGPTPFPGRRK
jgi:hypothetical protein